MAETYRLTYFNSRGRAEICRLTLAAAGVEFEDKRITSEDWAKLKPTTVFGQLPILESGDLSLGQSATIARYIANKHGLGGKTPEDEARIDMIVDCFGDVMAKAVEVFHADDATKKEELIKKFQTEHWPGYLEKFEKLLITNKGGDGFFVGDKVSRADLNLLNAVDGVSVLNINTDFSKAPKLQALYNRVKSLPKVAKWLDSRPKTAH